MKYITLDPEEQEIENALSVGSLKPVKNLGTIKTKLQKAAAFTLNKTRNINIRLSEKALLKLKAAAASAGLPYQTLASSVLYRFANSPQ